eukprot:gene20743-22772_t
MYDSTGKQGVTVTYPIFKNGDATVRNKRVSQTYGYIGSVFQSLLIGIAEEKLEFYKKKIEVMTPAPMHSVLQKEDKMTAIDKFITRQSLTTAEVPSTSQPEARRRVHLVRQPALKPG